MTALEEAFEQTLTATLGVPALAAAGIIVGSTVFSWCIFVAASLGMFGNPFPLG